MSPFIVRFAGQRAYRLVENRWVRIPLDIARLAVSEGRAVDSSGRVPPAAGG